MRGSGLAGGHALIPKDAFGWPSFYRGAPGKRDSPRKVRSEGRRSSTAQADAFVPQDHLRHRESFSIPAESPHIGPGRKKRAGANAEEGIGLLRSE
jgi:hypothetical protein